MKKFAMAAATAALLLSVSTGALAATGLGSVTSMSGSAATADKAGSVTVNTTMCALELDDEGKIVSVSFEGVRSEVLLHALEDRGIYVSSGSACSSNHPGVSGTLKGIGVKQELLDSTLRFSFGMFNKKEEIDYAIEVLKELLPVLRRYRRG